MLSPRRKGRCGRSSPAPEKSQRSPAAREPGGPAMEEGSGFRLSAECLDEPPNSRVFVVLGKDTGEALIRERFAPFGDIQNIWLLRDKRTNESRGIAFIKFARSSQACRAMEEMHGRSLVPDTKPIKVSPPGRAASFLMGKGGRGRASGAWRDAPRPGPLPSRCLPAWRPRRAAGLGRGASGFAAGRWCWPTRGQRRASDPLLAGRFVALLGRTRGGFGCGACGVGGAPQEELRWVPPLRGVPTRGTSCNRPGEKAEPGNELFLFFFLTLKESL